MDEPFSERSTERKPSAQPSFSGSVLGLLLVLPALFLCFFLQFVPMLQTIGMSQSDIDILTESEYVGGENFNRLFQDPVFGQAVVYTLSIVFVRILIVAIIPPLVGMLIGGQASGGRWFNRVLLSIIAVFLSPVLLASLWSLFFSQIWGREPSPLWPLPESFMLGAPEGARNNILLLDSLITIGIAAVVGGTAFIAVMRGREISVSTGRAGIAVWLLGILLTIVSLPQTFELPYLLTGGGPGRTTTTLPLALYQYGFVTFRIGYAAAIDVILLLPILISAFLVWAVLAGFRLRINYVPTPKPSESAGVQGFLSVPLLILIGLPSVGLILWGLWLASSYGGFAEASEVFPLWRVIGNTFLGPWLAIWLIQLPFTYLAGLGLGFYRPVNRALSEIVFLALLVMAFIPTEVLMFRWFMDMREYGILDTSLITGYAWLFGPFSLIIFKMFFEGARESYQAARDSGQTTSDAFTNTVFLPSLPIVLLVGIVLSFISAQTVLWPLVVVRSADLYSIPVQLLQLRGQFAMNQPVLAGAALSFAGVLTVLFLPAFILLQIFVLDRLAILAGPPVEAESLVEMPKRKPASPLPASDDIWA